MMHWKLFLFTIKLVLNTLYNKDYDFNSLSTIVLGNITLNSINKWDEQLEVLIFVQKY
jgi:hypothetical protein